MFALLTLAVTLTVPDALTDDETELVAVVLIAVLCDAETLGDTTPLAVELAVDVPHALPEPLAVCALVDVRVVCAVPLARLERVAALEAVELAQPDEDRDADTLPLVEALDEMLTVAMAVEDEQPVGVLLREVIAVALGCMLALAVTDDERDVSGEAVDDTVGLLVAVAVGVVVAVLNWLTTAVAELNSDDVAVALAHNVARLVVSSVTAAVIVLCAVGVTVPLPDAVLVSDAMPVLLIVAAFVRVAVAVTETDRSGDDDTVTVPLCVVLADRGGDTVAVCVTIVDAERLAVDECVDDAVTHPVAVREWDVLLDTHTDALELIDARLDTDAHVDALSDVDVDAHTDALSDALSELVGDDDSDALPHSLALVVLDVEPQLEDEGDTEVERDALGDGVVLTQPVLEGDSLVLPVVLVEREGDREPLALPDALTCPEGERERCALALLVLQRLELPVPLFESLGEALTDAVSVSLRVALAQDDCEGDAETVDETDGETDAHCVAERLADTHVVGVAEDEREPVTQAEREVLSHELLEGVGEEEADAQLVSTVLAVRVGAALPDVLTDAEGERVGEGEVDIDAERVGELEEGGVPVPVMLTDSERAVEGVIGGESERADDTEGDVDIEAHAEAEGEGEGDGESDGDRVDEADPEGEGVVDGV